MTADPLPCPSNCTSLANGACIGWNGVCTCARGWTGAACAVLDGSVVMLKVTCAASQWDADQFTLVRLLALCVPRGALWPCAQSPRTPTPPSPSSLLLCVAWWCGVWS